MGQGGAGRGREGQGKGGDMGHQQGVGAGGEADVQGVYFFL